MPQPLVNKKYLLEKYPGKGGWTYTLLHDIPATLRSRGGLVRVRGFIDDFEITSYNLFPIKDKPTTYFFPVRVEVRKKIKKQAGDYVRITLYADNEPLKIPKEIMLCLQDVPEAFKFFHSLNESEQRNYIKWISLAKTDETKVDRIEKSITRLQRRQKFNDG